MIRKINYCINVLIFLFFSSHIIAQSTFIPKPVELPNGWSLSPAGRALKLSSDLPLNIAISPSKKYAAITDNGNGAEGIELINIANKKLLSFKKIRSAWVGLEFSHDNKYLYAST